MLRTILPYIALQRIDGVPFHEFNITIQQFATLQKIAS